MKKSDIQEAIEVIESISLIKGAGSQQKIKSLLQNEDTPTLRYLLTVALDPFYVTHLKTINYEAFDEVMTEDSVYDFETLVDMLLSSKALTNVQRDTIKEYVDSYPLQYRQILSQILTKSLNVGIGAKLVNSAFGSNLISDPSLMLAQDDVDKFLKNNENQRFIAEEKYDGVRIAVMINNEDYTPFFYTRNFLELDKKCIPLLTEQIQTFTEYNNLGGYFLDGELIAKDRTTISGKVGSILKGKGKPNMDSDWIFVIFDIEKHQVLHNSPTNTPYEQRRKLLEDSWLSYTMSSIMKDKYPHVMNLAISETFPCKNQDDVEEAFEYIVSKGGEGLILKSPGHVYECKRSSSWIKRKLEQDVDLLIVGWFKGKSGTKRETTIGGFSCQTSDGLLQVNVGSGFTDADLEYIMQCGPDSFIGKIATIRYNTIIHSKNSEIASLFLPRFIAIREDKTEADSIEKVI